MAKMSGRIKWCDIAKGITILFVIVGHTLSDDNVIESVLRGMIFSFHMPLFFILSAFTYKWADDYKSLIVKVKKSCIHLLVPYLLIVSFQIIHESLVVPQSDRDLYYFRGIIYSLVFSSGTKTLSSGIVVDAIGAAWFLIALLIARTIYNIILIQMGEQRTSLICVIFSLLGISVGTLPLSLDIALAVLPFIYLGHRMAKTEYWNENKDIRYFLISFVLWGATLYLTFPEALVKSYLELADRRYPLFPVCFICAFAGAVFVFEVSRLLEKIKLVSFFEFIGRNSLYLYMVHCIDHKMFLANAWMIEQYTACRCIYRIIYDLILFLFLLGFKKGMVVFYHKKRKNVEER